MNDKISNGANNMKSQEGISRGGYKKLFLLFLFTSVLFAVNFGILWVKGEYTEKLLQKAGVVSVSTEEQRADYWTCFSWKSCLEQLNIDADVVFFGDSITRGGNFKNAFPEKTIVNLGISGDSLDGMYKRIDMIEAVSPEKIFVEGGINGMSHYTVDQTIELYENLLKALKDMYPNAEIYVQGIFPVNESLNDNSNKKIAEVNVGVSTLCTNMEIIYIDLYSIFINEDGQLPEEYTFDGIHLTDDAYELWFEYIKTYIFE